MLATLKRLFSGQNAAPAAQNSAVIGAINLRIEEDGWADVGLCGDQPWVTPQGKVAGVQHIEAEDLQALNSAVNAANANPDWAGIPLHEGHPKDGPALAWIKQSRLTAQNVLQVLPEWSEMGRKLILENKAYKWLSGGWDGILDAQRRFRPRVFTHVGVTNRPNINGLGAVCSQGDPDEAGKGGLPSPEPSPDGDSAVGSAANAATPAAKSPTEGSGESTTPRPPEALNADTGWLETFLGRLREMIGAAATEAEAMKALSQKWDVLYQARAQVESLQALVRGIGNSLAVAMPPAQDAPIPAEKLMAAVTAATAAANRAADLDKELAATNSRFAEFAVEQAIARNRVAPDKRSAALQIALAHREAAINCWFGGPTGGRAAVQVAPPSSPLAGVSLPGGVPVPHGLNVAPAPSADAVKAAVNAHIETHPGCDYPTAFNAVYPKLTKPNGAVSAQNRKE